MLSEAVQVQELSQGERTKACIRRDPEGYARQDLRRPVATYLDFPLASRERVEGHWAALFLRFWFLELR